MIKNFYFAIKKRLTGMSGGLAFGAFGTAMSKKRKLAAMKSMPDKADKRVEQSLKRRLKVSECTRMVSGHSCLSEIFCRSSQRRLLTACSMACYLMEMTKSTCSGSHLTPGLRLLVADRDTRFKELVQTFLGAAGHQITFVDDGIEALASVRRLRPQVLVTEIMLPKLDGLALCRAVKADNNLLHTRVLVFSILAASSRAKEAGADGFLGKPLVKEHLVAALRHLMSTII